jgi:hypothetical protein
MKAMSLTQSLFSSRMGFLLFDPYAQRFTVRGLYCLTDRQGARPSAQDEMYSPFREAQCFSVLSFLSQGL